MGKIKGKRITDEELLNELKRIFNVCGFISKENINKYGKYKDFNYYRRFGSTNNAVILAGIDINKNKINKHNNTKNKFNKKYTREQLIYFMEDYINKYGIPTTREFDKKEGYPNSYSYRKEFGSFQKALDECGVVLDEHKKKLLNRKKYSEKELLKIFKEKHEEYFNKTGRLLTDEVIDELDMPSASCYYKKFKTLDNTYLQIGIDRKKFYNGLLEEDMKKKYVEIRNIIGRTPNSRDINKFSKNNDYYYSCTTYLNHFGSIEKLNLLMGDKPSNYSKVMTDEEMFNGLKRLNEELGIVPTQKEVEICNYCGSISDYRKRFGSFVEAIIKAGMTPRSKKELLITPKGNKALSGYEYKFMLVLEKYNISYKKEEYYKQYIKDFNKNYRFDFTFNINNKMVFVEIFGITGNKKYNKKMDEKIKLCKENNLTLIEFYPNEIGFNSFEEIFKLLNEKLNEKGIDEIDGETN